MILYPRASVDIGWRQSVFWSFRLFFVCVYTVLCSCPWPLGVILTVALIWDTGYKRLVVVLIRSSFAWSPKIRQTNVCKEGYEQPITVLPICPSYIRRTEAFIKIVKKSEDLECSLLYQILLQTPVQRLKSRRPPENWSVKDMVALKNSVKWAGLNAPNEKLVPKPNHGVLGMNLDYIKQIMNRSWSLRGSFI